MVREVVVRNGDSSRRMNNIDKAIGAASEKAMVNPNMRRCEYTDRIAIRAEAMTNVHCSTPNKARLPRLTVMNTNPMYNNMAHTLYSDARPVSNLHLRSPPINSLETIHNQLIFQRNHHVLSKNDPKRLSLNYTITKCAWFGIHRIIRRGSDYIHGAILSSHCAFTKAYSAVSQGAAIRGPIGLSAPARVYWVHDFFSGRLRTARHIACERLRGVV